MRRYVISVRASYPDGSMCATAASIRSAVENPRFYNAAWERGTAAAKAAGADMRRLVRITIEEADA